MATEHEIQSQQPEASPRGKDKWGIETYLKGSLIVSIATVVAAMILYVDSMLKTEIGGVLLAFAVIGTLLAYVYGTCHVAVRTALRVLIYVMTAAAMIGTVFAVVVCCLQPLDPMPSIGMYALSFSPLMLFTLPVLAAMARARKRIDIWTFRVVAIVYAVMLAVGCLFGTYVEWGLSSGYIKLFVWLLAALTANFACLISTKAE